MLTKMRLTGFRLLLLEPVATLAILEGLSNNDLAAQRGVPGLREGAMNMQKDPSLSELLDDPIVIVMMKCDGVTREFLSGLFQDVRQKIRENPERAAA